MEKDKNTNLDIKQIKSNLLQGSHIDIFGDDYDTEVHSSKYYIHLYNELCCIYMVNANINLKSFVEELNKKFELTNDNYLLRHERSENKDIRKVDYNSVHYLIKIKEKLLIEVFNHRQVILYSPQMGSEDFSDLLDLIEASKEKEEMSKKFYMVASSSHSEFGFELQEFDIKKTEIDIQGNYNDDFFQVNDLIESFLKAKQQNGLVLLHGKYGTGKTTYLRYMIGAVSKRFIFLPAQLMENISSPNFLPFISQFPDSILILEDCEQLLMPRETGMHTNDALVNLLNLGDGLLADALSIKLICTFNADIKQIDKAILRKGRLVARYEFKALEKSKAQKIVDKIAKGKIIDKDMTLADIYNLDNEDFGMNANQRKVGF